MRRRVNMLYANGKAPTLNLRILCAPTALARGEGDHGGETSHSQSHPSHQNQPPSSPYDQPEQPEPTIHTDALAPLGPNQLMQVGASGPSAGQPHQMMPPPHGPASAPHSAAGSQVPPPPWLAQSGGERPGYNSEPQSYVRASHPPSHARASPQ